ncbi:MAG TPA: hypothetical protein ENK86_00275 [Campylobacterales bacterium]|nr:hypothetical protein [Campylobacterales bacterium]
MIRTKITSIFTILLLTFAFADNNISTDLLDDKITLLYVESDNCKYCKELDTLMHQGEPGRLLEAFFVVKKVNLNELELPEGLPMPYGVPTVYFLDDHNHSLIAPIRGMQNEEELMTCFVDAITENSEPLEVEEESQGNQSEEILYSQLSS